MNLVKLYLCLVTGSQKTQVQGTHGWGRRVERVYYGGPGLEVQREEVTDKQLTGVWIDTWVKGGCQVDWFEENEFEEITRR